MWNGFDCKEFIFKGRKATVILPENPRADRKWLFKTEYLDAFPTFEISMLKRGYYVANIENETRWGRDEDTQLQADFAKHLISEYGFYKKCLPVGMSCGGMQAVFLAAKHPELVAALYLDAPVLNFLSCPGGVGKSTNEMFEEFQNATGLTYSELINYRKHPIDYVKKLIEEKIPVFLVCGDSDFTVPYCENGQYLAEMYENSDIEFHKVIKPGCAHHPHGLNDCSEIIKFAENNY